mmetsp:Transcript_5071/g.10351  ORF Transcript_5071/g.10351 Transcript_5071/m.10351 type:complete len:85 (+) Transcript_5071:2561-2815(+)
MHNNTTHGSDCECCTILYCTFVVHAWRMCVMIVTSATPLHMPLLFCYSFISNLFVYLFASSCLCVSSCPREITDKGKEEEESLG